MDVCGVYINKSYDGMEGENMRGGRSYGGNKEFMRFISETFCNNIESDYESLPSKFKVLDICT